MNDETHESRISKLEQSMDDHKHYANERFDRNDLDHGKIYEISERIETKVDLMWKDWMGAKKFMLGSLFVIGGIAGALVASWDWLWHHLTFKQ